MTEQWLPYDDPFAKILLDSLVDQHRQFRATLRFTVPAATALPALLLTDTDPACPLYLDHDDREVDDTAQAGDPSTRSWHWNVTTAMPDLPAAGSPAHSMSGEENLTAIDSLGRLSVRQSAERTSVVGSSALASAMLPRMKVYRAVARALHDNGQRTIFGLLGDANMQYCGEFIETGGRFVGAVHEGGSVSMADGFARMSGHAAVVSVTHGPGVTNTMTALTEAVRAGSPLLLMTGDTPPRRDFVQQVDLRAAAALCGAGYRQVLLAEHVVDDIAKALQHVARTRLPMILDIPYSLLNQELDYAPSRFSGLPSAVPAPDEEALDVALGILASARRPVVLAGGGAVRSRAREELVALADRLGAPLATTLLAKDFFTGEPANLGVFGTVSHDIAMDTIVAADCVVAFGASLNDYTTAHGDLLKGKSVIHCDVRPGAVGRYSAIDSAMLADARLVARMMREQLDLAEIPPTRFRTQELERRLREYDPATEFTDASTDATMDMRSAIIALDDLLPEKRAVVTDCGRFMRAPWRYLHVGGGGLFQHTVNFGSIGLGLATAVGAAVADPAEITVAVAGDGGAMMGLMELTTAVREQLRLVVVVLNDGSYGAEYTKLADAGLDPQHSLIDWPEFADLARDMGASGVTVRTRADLERAVAMVQEGSLPLLIDVKADPGVDIGILS